MIKFIMGALRFLKSAQMKMSQIFLQSLLQSRSFNIWESYYLVGNNFVTWGRKIISRDVRELPIFFIIISFLCRLRLFVTRGRYFTGSEIENNVTSHPKLTKFIFLLDIRVRAMRECWEISFRCSNQSWKTNFMNFGSKSVFKILAKTNFYLVTFFFHHIQAGVHTKYVWILVL